ncbi:MAG TPA: ABC transporter permease [Pyrinomonadaceae bacterium]|jgi:putative ABC transport system permease protein
MMLSRLARRLRALLRKRRAEHELDEELRYHLERLIEQNIAGGMSPEEARFEARRSFGGLELAKEECREARGVKVIEDLWHDLRYGARRLRKNPGFTAVAVLTLALGIGANTAIFSVVNSVLLRPLPFSRPERLTMIWNNGVPAAGGDRTPLAVADLLDLRAQNRSFQSVDAFQSAFYNYNAGDSPERIRGARVTAGFFTTLGAQAALGRTFNTDEERPGAERVVVLSHRFWVSHLAANREVIGRALSLSGRSFTIVGVMPEAFDFPTREAQVWTALQLEPPARRGPYFLSGIARLKDGVELEQARAESRALRSTLSGEKFDFNYLPVNEFIFGDVRPALLVLLVAVTIVLLIASANVANLLLARAAGREKEISIRAALGASRGRIVRQLLSESLLLALLGGAASLLLAFWGVDLMLKLAPEGIPRLEEIRIDASALGWTALISLLTGIVFGLAPALQGSRLNLNEALKEGGRSSTESLGKRRWRNVLVVAELAMATMLLIGASLLLKSFWRLQKVDPGVDPERVLTMDIALRGERYAEPEQVQAFSKQLLERVAALPGVRAVAVSNSLPPDERDFSSDFTVEGQPLDARKGAPVADFILASKDYFRVLTLPLRRGRYFTDADSKDAPRVVIINESLERQFFAQGDAIGRRLNLSAQGEPEWAQIVGVVGDVKYTGLETETQPAIYQPVGQNPSWGMFLIVKTEAADPLTLTPAIRREVRAIDQELPVANVSTLEHRLAVAVTQPRFRTTLIAVFAGIALVLASVGIYGVISYSVTQRTHEIGIRMALGARAVDVLGLLLKQGMLMAVVGVGLGLIAAFALTRLMRSLLFGVSATDPSTFILIALLLTTVALLATYLPARRAMKVDPLVALRAE